MTNPTLAFLLAAAVALPAALLLAVDTAAPSPGPDPAEAGAADAAADAYGAQRGDLLTALRTRGETPGADVAGVLRTAGAGAPEPGPCPTLQDAIAVHAHRMGVPVPVLPALPGLTLDTDVAEAAACLLDALARANAAQDALFAGIPGRDIVAAVEDTEAQDALMDRLAGADPTPLRDAAAAVALRVDQAMPALEAARGGGTVPTLDLAPILLIDDSGDSYHRDNYVLALELSGDDVYDNHAGGILVSIHLGLHDVHDAPNGIRVGGLHIGDHVQDADMVLSSSLVLDLDGNDQYGVYQAPMHKDPRCTTEPIPPVVGAQGGAIAGFAMLMDLAGDDDYNGRTMAQGIGHLMGVGVLYDGGGTDTFTAVRSAQGQALLGGLGVLIQDGGDTTYETLSPAGGIWNGDLLICDDLPRYAQGAAFDRRAGTGPPSSGFLIDRGGNDRYTATDLSQGFAQAPGAGILLDQAGDDQYDASARSQGAGQGRSKEFNPQAPWSGGIAALLDDAGNDRYSASTESQGWSLGPDATPPPLDPVGILQWALDRNEAVGILRDAAGSDSYDQPGRGDGAVHVDGTLGLFVDQ